jgi:hypothetical protein
VPLPQLSSTSGSAVTTLVSQAVRLSARVMRRLAIIASRNNVSSGQVARWIFAAIDRENLFEELMERGRGRK